LLLVPLGVRRRDLSARQAALEEGAPALGGPAAGRVGLLVTRTSWHPRHPRTREAMLPWTSTAAAEAVSRMKYPILSGPSQSVNDRRRPAQRPAATVARVCSAISSSSLAVTTSTAM